MAGESGQRWRVIDIQPDIGFRYRLTYLVDGRIRHVVHFPVGSYTAEAVAQVGQRLVELPDWRAPSVYG